MIQTVLIFATLQLINVILSTVRSVATIRSSRWVAALLSAIYFGFYTVIIIYTVDDSINLWIKVAITATINFIGTYAGRWIADRFAKERMWEIVATVEDGVADLQIELSRLGVFFLCNEATTDSRTIVVFHIYSQKRESSRSVRIALTKYNAFYVVHEENGRL